MVGVGQCRSPDVGEKEPYLSTPVLSAIFLYPMRMGTYLSAGLNISFSVSSAFGREGQGEDGSRTRLQLLPSRARAGVSSSPSSSSSSYAERTLARVGVAEGPDWHLGVAHYCWSVYETLDLDSPLSWWTVVPGAVLRRLGAVCLQTGLV